MLWIVAIAKYKILLTSQIRVGFTGAVTRAFTPASHMSLSMWYYGPTDRDSSASIINSIYTCIWKQANGINQLTPFNTTLVYPHVVKTAKCMISMIPLCALLRESTCRNIIKDIYRMLDIMLYRLVHVCASKQFTIWQTVSASPPFWTMHHATKQSSPYPAYSSSNPTDYPVWHQADSAIKYVCLPGQIFAELRDIDI